MDNKCVGGETLRQARQAAGLTQEEAARRSGIRLRQWCRYERGENVPSPERQDAIARVLGRPKDDLFAEAAA